MIDHPDYSVLLNGSYVTDVFSAVKTDKLYSNKAEDVYKFFLIHNITEGQESKAEVNALYDGYIGMASNLGHNQETFGQYLKRRGEITSDSFTTVYDRD
jgi:hypothetical protein